MLLHEDVKAPFAFGDLPPRDIDDLRNPDEIPWDEDLIEAIDEEAAGEAPLPGVPLRVRLGYGLGEMGLFTANSILSYYLTPFLLDVALIPASTVALIQLAATAFDAITDLGFGLVTDATRSDLGRRRPYILLGAIIWSGMFLGLFQSPPLNGSAALAFYIIMLLLYKGTNTLCAVPYYGLISEITPSYTERTRLSGLRLLVSLSASAIINFLWAIVISAFPLATSPDQADQELGYAAAAVMFLPVILLPAVGVFTQIKEPPIRKAQEKALPFRQLIGSVFSNKPFLLVVCIYSAVFLAINFIQNNLLLWVKYVVQIPDQFSWVILCLQGTACLSIFVWVPVANRFGKRITFMMACVPFATAVGLDWLIEPSYSYTIFPLAIICGMCVGALMLMPWSMMADCVDIDELNTGKRREGIFFAAFVLFQKFALAGALAASNYTLAGAGYINHPSGSPNASFQPEEVIEALKIMVGPAAAGIALIALVPAFFYPLTKEKHQEVLDKLHARRKQQAVTRRTTRRVTRKTGKAHSPIDSNVADLDEVLNEYEQTPLVRN